ncbi:MAG: glycosyltransferase family 2 protein [Nanoarchaeota archaeon]|nr:glycosyltransferase family 2 protein [Nanoarchaeota archaeon]
MKKIIVVMPAYDVGKKVETVFKRVPESILKKISKFIVVNDGSTDNTANILKLLSKSYKIKVISHNPNKGYGAAQKSGLKEALRMKADIVVLLHSDGQHAPEVMDNLLYPIEKNQADVVQGSRILGGKALKEGMPMYKYFGNRILTFIENLSYGMNMAEYHSGYMVYSRKTLETIPFEKLTDKFHFDGEMLLVAKKKGLRIKEIPIPTKYAEEKSHLNPITYGIEVLKTIINYWRGKYNL